MQTSHTNDRTDNKSQLYNKLRQQLQQTLASINLVMAAAREILKLEGNKLRHVKGFLTQFFFSVKQQHI